MVVDDDVDALSIFCDYLELKGYDVVARGNDGKEAVGLYKKHRPDIVLSDVMMPNYDGFYMARQIKDIDPDAKMIMITASLEKSSIQSLIDAGASEVMYKPFEVSHVIDLIDKVLYRKP